MAAVSSKRSLVATGGLSLLALLLCSAPEPTTRPLRTWVRDLSLPGCRAVVTIRSSLGSRVANWWAGNDLATELPDLRAELDLWKQRTQRLNLQNALLNQRLETLRREGSSPYEVAAGTPLIVPELLGAVVLGEQDAALWREGLLIDRGGSAGVAESDLVLNGTAALVDQGEDAGLEPDLPIYAGRNVVGKVRDVGRWTSTIERVTDVGYHGFAQLAWQSADQRVFGAEGIIEGDGEGFCRLRKVAATEAVSLGDDVYTAQQSSVLPYPMYYGKVVKAELKPGALYWDIVVEPVTERFELRTVQILTARRNPQRPLGN